MSSLFLKGLKASLHKALAFPKARCLHHPGDKVLKNSLGPCFTLDKYSFCSLEDGNLFQAFLAPALIWAYAAVSKFNC